MTPIELIALRAGPDFPRGSAALEAYNVERVRGYLEENLGCTKKEVCHQLKLNPRTVAKAVLIIRGKLQPRSVENVKPSRPPEAVQRRLQG